MGYISGKLTFSVDLKNQQVEDETKETMLQTTAWLHDPLGRISPFTLRARVLLQRLWRLSIDLGDILPEDKNQQETKNG